MSTPLIWILFPLAFALILIITRKNLFIGGSQLVGFREQFAIKLQNVLIDHIKIVIEKIL